jgi:hypothetical protein
MSATKLLVESGSSLPPSQAASVRGLVLRSSDDELVSRSGSGVLVAPH